MGIQGLIPFMEKASRQVNVKQYAGYSVAVDAYCWLHKGAFSCAEKLARGEPTNAYVLYCMKFVNMLLAANVTPILVFDGRHLPAKACTEKKRRESREVCRKRAAELLRAGRVDEARSFLRRCIDVTHEMALALMKECRRIGVDCIVAPYEADAQLAFLNLKGMADIVITEDSDLVLFGCSRILFKMDLNGNGLLVEQERLFMAMRVRPEVFCFDKFRHMCILSGCDYLASLPGIGLSKACKFVTKTAETDIHKALVKLPSYLNMTHLTVTQQYRDDFVRAVETFRYQLVFDPVSRKLVPLTDPPEEYCRDPSAGEMLPCDVAYQLALGNLDPFTLRKVDDFHPDACRVTHGKRQRMSIWSSDYKPKARAAVEHDVADVDRPTTRRKVVAVSVSLQAKKQDVSEDKSFSDVDLAAMYGEGDAAGISPLKRTHQDEILATPDKSASSEEPPCKQSRYSDEPPPPTYPLLGGRLNRNPFALRGGAGVSALDRLVETATSRSPLHSAVGSKFGALGKLSRCQGDSPRQNVVVCSRYFVTEADNLSGSKELTLCDEKIESTEVSDYRLKHNSTDFLKDVSNVIELNGGSGCEAIKKSSFQNTEVGNFNLPKTNDGHSPAKVNRSLCLVKEDLAENKSPRKSQMSFKWGDLKKRFSFEANNSLKSSQSTSQAFKNPYKEESLTVSSESVMQDVSLSQESVILSGGSASSTDADSGFVSDSPCSQRDKTPSSPDRANTKTCRRPGLKKPAKQQSLLNLFGFQKKTKLAPV